MLAGGKLVASGVLGPLTITSDRYHSSFWPLQAVSDNTVSYVCTTVLHTVLVGHKQLTECFLNPHTLTNMYTKATQPGVESVINNICTAQQAVTYSRH